MRQKRPFFYDVDAGENIEVNITPVEVGGAVRAAQNGVVLENLGSNAEPRFEFVASQSVRWHFLQIVFHFPAGSSNEAMYKVEFCGAGHECFKDLPVTNSGPSSEPTDRILRYEFEVAAQDAAAPKGKPRTRAMAGKKGAKKKRGGKSGKGRSR